MSTPSPHHISLFEPAINVDFISGDAREKNFSILDTLTFSNSPPDWWAMTLSIFIWMTISYAIIYLTATIVAAIFMRKHPYVVLVTIPMALMCVVGPVTVGIITSMVIAFTLSASDKYITHIQCCLLGYLAHYNLFLKSQYLYIFYQTFQEMNECIGAVIAVDCGADGYYQGKLAQLDLVGESRGIILSNAFREGMPCGKMLRLEVNKIQSVKVLKTAESETPPVAESLAVPKKPAIKSVSNKNPVSNKTNSSIPETPSKGKSLKWVIRPLKNETDGKDYSTSSDIESHSSIENKPKIQKKKVKPSQRSKEVHATAVQTVENTPTPMFTRYEPQVPKPQSLSVPAWAVKSVRKGQGPCGIPILDVQNGYGPISRRNAHLDNPIDFEELSRDFDFDSNLNMFDKDNVETDDEDFYEAIEKPKMSRNFKHDENILSDPSRVTSWTTVTAKNCYSADELPSSSATKVRAPRQMSFCPSSFEKVSNGSKVPSLNETIKSKYLECCVSHLTPIGYSSVVADRLLSYFFEIVQTSQMSKELTIVVLSHSTVSDMAARFSSALVNRRHRVHVLGEVGDVFGIKRVFHPKTLPANPHLIVSLHRETSVPLGSSYFKANHDSHILSLESHPPVTDLSKTHVLMLGVLTEGLYSAPATLTTGKTTFAALCGAVSYATPVDYRVADIGVPFSWIVDGGAEALVDAFATDILIRP